MKDMYHIISIVILAVLVFCFYRLCTLQIRISSTSVSRIPFHAWSAFVASVSFASFWYTNDHSSIGLNPVTTITLLLLALSIFYGFFANKFTFLSLHVVILLSWFCTAHQFLHSAPGTIFNDVFSPKWIVSVLCSTSILLLPVLQEDCVVEVWSLPSLIFFSLSLLLGYMWIIEGNAHFLPHIESDYHSSSMVSQYLHDLKFTLQSGFMHKHPIRIHELLLEAEAASEHLTITTTTQLYYSGLCVVLHFLFWGVGKWVLSAAAAASAGGRSPEMDEVEEVNEKIQEDLKIPAQAREFSKQFQGRLPDDCVEISVEDAIKLTMGGAGVGAARRRKKET